MLSRHKKLLKYLKSEKDYLLCPVLITKPSDKDDFAASSFFSKNLRIDWYVRLGPVKNVMCVKVHFITTNYLDIDNAHFASY